MAVAPTLGTTEELLEARALIETFRTLDGKLPVLDGIDLAVRDGQLLGLLGGSGAASRRSFAAWPG